MDQPLSSSGRWLVLFLLICGTPVLAAARSEIVKADLESLIRAAAPHPAQFAVSVPHAVSDITGGAWSVSGDIATWQYSVRIPTAVSLSFRAINTRLPASARLTVRGKVHNIGLQQCRHSAGRATEPHRSRRGPGVYADGGCSREKLGRLQYRCFPSWLPRSRQRNRGPSDISGNQGNSGERNRSLRPELPMQRDDCEYTAGGRHGCAGGW